MEASKEIYEVWKSFVATLSKGELPIADMTFNSSEYEWEEITVERAIELGNNLPTTV